MTLLLVGARRGALIAARALGHEVLLLDESGRAGGRARWAARAECSLESDPEVLDRTVLELCRGRTVDAVVACTERGVRAAARARSLLGLAGQAEASALACRDKHVMKRRLREAGLPCTDDVPLTADLDPHAVLRHLGSPCVVKPRDSSGHRGMELVSEPAELAGHLREGWMAERFVHGEEMSVEAFLQGGEALFVNPTEYLVNGHANVLPAVIDPDELVGLRRLVVDAARALGVERGLVHLELFRTDRGPVIGELAARPPGGHIMEGLARAYDFDPWRVLLELELGHSPRLPERAVCTAVTWVLHPGSGTLLAVEGQEAACAVPGVHRVHLRVEAGDRIDERLGTGEDIGWIEASGRDRDEVVGAARRAHDLLRFVFV